MKIQRLLAGALGLVLLLTGCGRNEPEPVDPHAGMVQVRYGSDGFVWVDEQEGVPLSTFRAEEFSADGQFIRYSGTDYTTKTGIDVSEHQLDIDWRQVKDAGVEFAMIRAGYRGSTQGGLYTDEFFHQNMQGALDAGVEVGAYFFSQATSRAEAVAEANYFQALLEPYQERLTMPAVFDWEETGAADARTAGIENRRITDCAQAFCQAMAEAGYTPFVYLNRHMGYYQYDLAALTDYALWFAAPDTYPDFYYRHLMWQYSFEGQVPGIPTAVDLDLYFMPEAPAEVPETESVQ